MAKTTALPSAGPKRCRPRHEIPIRHTISVQRPQAQLRPIPLGLEQAWLGAAVFWRRAQIYGSVRLYEWASLVRTAVWLRRLAKPGIPTYDGGSFG